VLRVYLDQNKWIDLARAATGHRAGERFQDALEMSRAAVQCGAASFPLDMYRYWETGKRGDDRSRNAVADVMWELSQQHTMTVPFGVLDHEIDLALRRRYGRPDQPRQQQVFGVGLRHITSGRMEWPKLDLSANPCEEEIPAVLRAQLDHAVGEFVEDHILRAGPHIFRQVGFDHASSDHAQRFVDFENTVAAGIAQHGLTGDSIDQAVRGADFGDTGRP
jgi:hypothetical protein